MSLFLIPLFLRLRLLVGGLLWRLAHETGMASRLSTARTVVQVMADSHYAVDSHVISRCHLSIPATA